MSITGLSLRPNSAGAAVSPKRAGSVTTARSLPRRTASAASVASSGCTSNVASCAIASTIFVDVALRSRSMIAIGTLARCVSFEPPNSDPKNAAMAIGAATVISSARRFEK